MTESEAFLRQARSDFSIYQLLHETEGLPKCHELHYLQMNTEKLAKAVRLVFGGSSAAGYSHAAFSKLAGVLRMHRPTAAAMDMEPRAFRHFIRRTSALMAEIEQLHPQLGAAANVEYPWRGRDASGSSTWHAPIDYHFPITSKLNHYPDGQSLLKLIDRSIHNFNRLFRDER